MYNGNYDNYHVCEQCSGENEILNYSGENWWINECHTKCKNCDHEAYWVTGFYANDEI